jgi:hypothetical protein
LLSLPRAHVLILAPLNYQTYRYTLLVRSKIDYVRDKENSYKSQ